MKEKSFAKKWLADEPQNRDERVLSLLSFSLLITCWASAATPKGIVVFQPSGTIDAQDAEAVAFVEQSTYGRMLRIIQPDGREMKLQGSSIKKVFHYPDLTRNRIEDRDFQEIADAGREMVQCVSQYPNSGPLLQSVIQVCREFIEKRRSSLVFYQGEWKSSPNSGRGDSSGDITTVSGKTYKGAKVPA